LISM